MDSGEATEARSLEGRRAFPTEGRLGDVVVEIANVTIAAIFLYRRIKNLFRSQKPDRQPEG